MPVLENSKIHIGPPPYQSILDTSIRDGQLIVGLPKPFRIIHVMERPAGFLLTFHTHAWYHINYICSGSLCVSVKDQDYQVSAGQVFIMPPIPHQLTSKNGYSQIGVDVLVTEDSRNISQMIQDTFSNQAAVLAIPPVSQDFSTLYEMIRSMTPLDSLMLINIAESIVYRCVEEVRRPERNDSFRSQFINLLKRIDPFRTSLDEIASALNLSRTHLERLTNREFGCGVMEYCNKIKSSHLCLVLQTSQKSITQLAEEFNFYDESHLCVFFKKYTGKIPGQYRRDFQKKYGTASKHSDSQI